MKVCIGGTFNIFHSGHKFLIDKAFETAGTNGSVFIGLSSGDLINSKKKVETFKKRKKVLECYLTEKGFLDRAFIKPITDKYGPSINGEFDAIVVSGETVKTAKEINYKRRKKGNKPLKIIKIPLILAKDGIPISSSRIKNKEIDTNGMVLYRD